MNDSPDSLPSSRYGNLVRWGWFVVVMLTVFGYLVSGLSRRERPSAATARLAAENGDSLSASIRTVNQAWRTSLAKQDLDCAAPADWLTVCRRQSLALVGSQLSLEEIRALEKLEPEQRASSHLEQLLDDPRFHSYWAERWTRFLVGTDEGQFIVFRRRRFRSWLTQVFRDNWRYDRLVTRLITAEGLWTDKPEVNFITATFDSNDNAADPVRLAARTARCFLGLRIDCLQCHNDFLGNVCLGPLDDLREGQQTDFHQLAAFYTSAKTNGFLGVTSGAVDYRYTYLDEEEETNVRPAVPYQQELLPEDGSPRARLAHWVTHPNNRQAARSAVSHIWALMYGRPMAEAVDNLPLDEEMPLIMEALTDEFIRCEFDVRHLIRLIAGSSAYRVDSRADFEILPAHERAGAVFPLVRLRPEQVAASIVQSARIKSVDRDSSFFIQLQKFGGIQDFVSRYGDMGEDEFNDESITITQRLVMLNGNMLDEAVGYNPFLNASAHIDMFADKNSEAVDSVYLCALNRRPTPKERDVFTQRFTESDDRAQSVEDLFWVLLNSTEFAWGH